MIDIIVWIGLILLLIYEPIFSYYGKITFLRKILQKIYLKVKYKSNIETNKPFITLEIEEVNLEFISARNGRERPAELVIKNTRHDDIAFKNEEPCGLPQGINSHITNTAAATLWQATGNYQVKSFKIDEHANKPTEDFRESILNNKPVRVNYDELFPNVGDCVYKLEYLSRRTLDEFCNCIIVEKSDYPSMNWNEKAKGDGAKLRLFGVYGRCKPCLYKEFLKNNDI